MTLRVHRVVPCASCGEACLWEASIPPPAVCIACRINSRKDRMLVWLFTVAFFTAVVWLALS